MNPDAVPALAVLALAAVGIYRLIRPIIAPVLAEDPDDSEG